MALRCIKLMRSIRTANTFRQSLYSTSVSFHEPVKLSKTKEYRTENNVVYYEDPDNFGTLSRSFNRDRVILEDEGDIEEEKKTKVKPIADQKLTIKQYSDIIKQYLKYKRLKEALNVLEVRMLQEDKVKPENYIYNILIGACADVGYTKKAFKLFNDMKKRGLKPTGDSYTCLFEACCNSPWLNDGLKKAKHLRELMIEKGIEPNLTNYNVMIKTFGRCGDLPAAFQIVDEMIAKKIKIRVHTFNHLLQACISDKENGLRHALIVWRKMLKMREKPNIYSFNLMLKCVKDCNLGSKDDILEMLSIIQEQVVLSGQQRILQIESNTKLIEKPIKETAKNTGLLKQETLKLQNTVNKSTDDNKSETSVAKSNELTVTENFSMQIVEKPKTPDKTSRNVPNLLSRQLQMQEVQALQEVRTVQDKFAIVGGQEDFFREMEEYSVKPVAKTFTQMVPLLEDTREAENKLLDTIKKLDVKVDIDFYNMLIKKRCFRLDYDGAFEVKDLIKMENKRRKKLYPLKKKLQIEPNVMTYGVLAMACKTKTDAESLLNEMKEEQLKVNIEILGTLLRQGTATSNFGYVLYIMNLVKGENIQINHVFLKHLEVFNEKCIDIANKKNNANDTFNKAFQIFSMAYKNWLKDINIDEVLKPEHPWAQFTSTYPETVQRQNIVIKEPRKFYKRQRKFIRYAPPV